MRFRVSADGAVISASEAMSILGVDSTKLSEFTKKSMVVKVCCGRYDRASVESLDRELRERREIVERSPVVWLEGDSGGVS